MNARDPLLPIQNDEAEALGRFAERVWDDEIVPQLTNYIAVPAKSPMFDAEWQRARLHRPRGARRRRLGRAQKVAGPEARGGPPRRPHAGDLLRRAGHAARRQRRRRRDDLLYGHLDKQPEFNGWRNDLGPWTPQATRTACSTAAAAPTTAMRSTPRSPRSRRSTLQGIAAAALRRPDRDLRGKRLARPAVLRRRAARRGSATSAWSSASTAAPATTTSSGSRPACAATSPARSRSRS